MPVGIAGDERAGTQPRRDAVTVYEPAAGCSLLNGKGVLQDRAGQPLDPEGHVVPEAHIRVRAAP